MTKMPISTHTAHYHVDQDLVDEKMEARTGEETQDQTAGRRGSWNKMTGFSALAMFRGVKDKMFVFLDITSSCSSRDVSQPRWKPCSFLGALT